MTHGSGTVQHGHDGSALPAQSATHVYTDVVPLQLVTPGYFAADVAARSDALFTNPTYDATVTIGGGGGGSPNVATYGVPQAMLAASGEERILFVNPAATTVCVDP